METIFYLLVCHNDLVMNAGNTNMIILFAVFVCCYTKDSSLVSTFGKETGTKI